YEYHPGIRLFTRKPRFAGFGTHHHMYALEQHASVNALHVQNALVAEQVGPVDLNNTPKKFLQAFRIEGPVRPKHECTDLVLVRMMVMGMIMMIVIMVAAVLATLAIVIMMVVSVRCVRVFFLEEFRVDIEN